VTNCAVDIGAVQVQVQLNTTATGKAYTAQQDRNLAVPADRGVLSGVTGASPASTLNATLVKGPTHGTLALEANGSFAYTPAACYAGIDAFDFLATDGCGGGTVRAIANISIGAQLGPWPEQHQAVWHQSRLCDCRPRTPCPAMAHASRCTPHSLSHPCPTDPANPTAVAQAYTTKQDHTLAVPADRGVLLDAASTSAAPALNVTLVKGPTHGTLALEANGSFVYTPLAGYFGADAFDFLAKDGCGGSVVATATITVGAQHRGGSGSVCLGCRTLLDSRHKL
jgi:hypothetical protein